MNRHALPPDAAGAAALKTGASLEHSPQETAARGRERILVVKFLPARLDAQSELFASELGDHLGILVPASRILRKQVCCHCRLFWPGEDNDALVRYVAPSIAYTAM